MRGCAGVAGPVAGQAERFPERVGEVSAACVPLFWSLGHGPGECLASRGGQVGPTVGQQRRGIVAVRMQDGQGVGSLEGEHASEQVPGYACERVLVGSPVHGKARALLGRRVRGAA